MKTKDLRRKSDRLLDLPLRKTVGGYFDKRIASPHQATGDEKYYLLNASEFNGRLPKNLSLIAGDPSLEIQAQVISQIGSQLLPTDTWKNVHNWLLDLVVACTDDRDKVTVIIDCNPSFSAYTELAMMASERLIIPCSSDGSSARAIDNIGALLYGIGSFAYDSVSFKAKSQKFEMSLPTIHSVLLNRSTQYNKKSSKAFEAMFKEIKSRTKGLREKARTHFVDGPVNFKDVPDAHSVSIVCAHQGCPLYALSPGRYEVHDTTPQVNPEPLDRYKKSIAALLSTIP